MLKNQHPWLWIAAFLMGMLVFAACTAPAQPESAVVEVTRVVTEVVEQVVEKEVQVVVTATPEPPPPGPPPFEPPTEVIAAGLFSPRQMFYTPDGTLYIAEAGIAGDAPIVVNPETVVGAGLTSRITKVSPDGTQSVAIPGLPSINRRPNDRGFRGAMAVLVTDDSYWVTIGEGPVGLEGLPLFRLVLELDRDTWRIRQVVDTYTAAKAAVQPEPEAENSDPTDFALADDGTLFIADAGCNCVWTWTEDDGLQLFAAWDIDDNPVPTAVDFGPDGDLYISFLSGFPFPEGTARIERRSRDGALEQTYGGLNLLTDVLVTDDGTIYAVQLAAGFGDRGFIPDSGSVIIVSEDGVTPVLEGLRAPYGLAQAPDGRMVVSVVSFGDISGGGMVIAVEGP